MTVTSASAEGKNHEHPSRNDKLRVVRDASGDRDMQTDSAPLVVRAIDEVLEAVTKGLRLVP